MTLPDHEGGKGSSHPQPVSAPKSAAREASPSASAHLRALKNRVHEAHQAVQLADDMEAIRAACRALSFANNALIVAAQNAEDETRQAAERQFA